MSRSEELLEKVKQENSIKANVPDEPYVKLILNKQRRQVLTMVCFVVFVAYLVILNRSRLEEAHWVVSALPIVGLGIMMALIPAVEEWEYVPWQTAARQYERHQIER